MVFAIAIVYCDASWHGIWNCYWYRYCGVVVSVSDSVSVIASVSVIGIVSGCVCQC